MTKKKIETILKKNFKLKPSLINKLFSNKVNIFDIPTWDSLEILKFYMIIEKQFNVKINNKNFNKLNTLNKILKFLNK